jgi:hypothetical protein
MSQNVDFLTGLGAGEERAESQYKQLKVLLKNSSFSNPQDPILKRRSSPYNRL